VKISLNTIRNINKLYGSADDVAKIGVAKLVDKIGAQLGAVEAVVDFGSKYQGIVVAKVVSCQPHQGADKLQVCAIDDGGITPSVKREANGYVQVVCGAPNVRAGLLVAWLPPGATVPSTVGKQPLVLEAREIRGELSQGMLASPKELGLGDDHSGILELDGDYQPGTDFAEALGLAGDAVIDIENKMFTHRPDCFGFLGIARELAGIQGLPYKSPDWYAVDPKFPAVEADKLPLEIKNELPELVPRFAAITMSGVKVGPSPLWLRVELAKVGQKSINNIVDCTNWFMLLTGQPLHAYDYDKLKTLSDAEATIVIRQPKKGEKIKLLNGKEIEPRAEAIMIATDKQLIGVGGIMGGTETEVDDSTKNIILECASFDMYSIRRTSMEHGLFTDAVTRFTKGQSPLQNLAVLAKTVDEIRQEANAKAVGRVIDDNHLKPAVMERQTLHAPVNISTDFMNARLGLKLSGAEIKTLLENVEFAVEVKSDELTVAAPFWRTDIELPEDIVEEVGRLHGYDKLPLELPKRDLTPAVKDPLLTLKAQVRERLSRAGANEVLTYSFVPGSLLDKTGQDKAKAFQVANALSPDLQYYRLSLMPSLLEKVHPGVKAGYDQFALFELGKTHSLDHPSDGEGVPEEFEFSALVVTANDKLKKPGAPYYQARKYLETLASVELEFKPVGKDMRQYPVVQPYDYNRSALVKLKDGDFLGIIGEFKPSVTRALKLPKYSAGFEIDTTILQPILAAGPSYSPLLRFPGVKQDITLKVPADVSYGRLRDFVNQQLGAKAPEDGHASLEPVGIYQKEPNTKNVSWRVTVTGLNRTLTDKEVNALLDEVAKSATDKFGAQRI